MYANLGICVKLNYRMQRLIKKTERNAVVYHEGRIRIITLPKGKEDNAHYYIFEKSMKRFEIVTAPNEIRGLAFCVEDTPEAGAVTFMVVQTLGES